jgi:hypothetical protein
MGMLKMAAKVTRVVGPLILDVGVPVGSYYVLKYVFGMSEVAALGWGSVYPALRTGWSAVRKGQLNGFAGLILVVNVISLGMTFVTGDARLMIVKDSAVTSAVGIGVLVSLRLGRPLMTESAKPWLLKGDARREAAFDRLRAGEARFRRAERRFSLVWGVALLGECVARIVLAYVLSVDTMVWFSTVLMVGSMVLAFWVSGAIGSMPMVQMILAEVRAQEGAVPDRTTVSAREGGEQVQPAPAVG